MEEGEEGELVNRFSLATRRKQSILTSRRRHIIIIIIITGTGTFTFNMAA
jgi:hypothetical protein